MLLTILQSMRTKTGIWKTSILPVLQALDGRVKSDLGNLSHLHQTAARSDSILVSLKKEDGHWVLVDRKG